MCGRYTLTIDKSTIEKRCGGRFYIAQPSFDWAPTYNAAPSQLLPIIRTHAPNRIELAKWGFVSEDWNNARIRPQNNARLETADEKPMFRDSFRSRHCLVLADSFYEWKTVATKKQPYRIMLKSGEPFAMAGIYARSGDHQFGEAESAPITFAILTTSANVERINAGGTAPTAAPARARPRPCAHPLPVSARATARAHRDGRHSTGTGALAFIAGAPLLEK